MTCTHCNTVNPEDSTNCSSCGAPLSEATDSLDSLVQAASVPNLASLFRKAKETGVIGSVSVYGESA